MTDLEKLLLNERELTKIYVQELLESKMYTIDFISRMQQMLNNTDEMILNRIN